MTGFLGQNPNAPRPDMPLARGPEPGQLDLMEAGANAEAIETDRWQLTSRRIHDHYNALSEKVYGDPRIWLRQRRTDFSGPTHPGEAEPLAPGRDQFLVSKLLADAAQMAAADPEKFAGVAVTRKGIKDEIYRQLREEYADAVDALDRSSGSYLSSASEFAGRFAAAATDPVNLALMAGTGGESLARVIAMQAGLGAVGEAATIPAQIRQAKILNIQPPNPAEQILFGAFAAGASAGLIHGVGRAISAGADLARGLPNSQLLANLRASGSKIPPLVRAASGRLARAEADRAANPGIAQSEHLAALDEAGRAAQEGRPGDLEPARVDPDRLRPQPPPAPKVAPLVERIIKEESGGRANARSIDPETGEALSTASGAAGMIESTWLNLMRKYRPDLAEGRSEAQVLALRDDPDLSRSMTNVLINENRNGLIEKNAPIDDGALYLAHFAGVGRAAKTLKAPPDTPLTDIFPAEVFAANPWMRGKTASDLVKWARTKMGIAVRRRPISGPAVRSTASMRRKSALTRAPTSSRAARTAPG